LKVEFIDSLDIIGRLSKLLLIGDMNTLLLVPSFHEEYII